MVRINSLRPLNPRSATSDFAWTGTKLCGLPTGVTRLDRSVRFCTSRSPTAGLVRVAGTSGAPALGRRCPVRASNSTYHAAKFSYSARSRSDVRVRAADSPSGIATRVASISAPTTTMMIWPTGTDG